MPAIHENIKFEPISADISACWSILRSGGSVERNTVDSNSVDAEVREEALRGVYNQVCAQ
jgi:hypothetical protein